MGLRRSSRRGAGQLTWREVARRIGVRGACRWLRRCGGSGLGADAAAVYVHDGLGQCRAREGRVVDDAQRDLDGRDVRAPDSASRTARSAAARSWAETSPEVRNRISGRSRVAFMDSPDGGFAAERRVRSGSYRVNVLGAEILPGRDESFVTPRENSPKCATHDLHASYDPSGNGLSGLVMRVAGERRAIGTRRQQNDRRHHGPQPYRHRQHWSRAGVRVFIPPKNMSASSNIGRCRSASVQTRRLAGDPCPRIQLSPHLRPKTIRPGG